MTSKVPNGSQNAGTDLGSLWTRAVHDYCKQTGKDLSRDMSARSMSDVMSSTEASMQSFQGFRHKGDKVDKVRSAFGRHLDGIQKCMHGIQVVGAMAGAFPPAMPVGIVFAACGHLLSAFAGVKADYDKVEDFFNHSSRFFERLSIIENKVSDNGALGKAIVRVFSAQLSVCAIVEVMTKTKAARFKQFLSALWNMQDPDLAASYGIMQASIEELAQTVGYASYAEIKSTQAITVTISAKADEIDDNIKKFRDQLGQDVRLVYESQLEMRAELAEGFHTTQAMLLEQAALQAERDARFHASVLKAIQGGKSKPENADNKRKQNTKGSGKGDPGDKKFKALRNIKAFFDSHAGLFPNWRDAYKENASQQTDMRDAYVEHTADWITNDSAFQQWAEGKNPLLWMKGPDGIGKSFLAHASLQKLPTRDEGSNSIAYFYFKEDFPYLQSAQNSFACAALQVAEANTKYAEQIAAKLKEDAENATSTPTWERFFLTVFGTSPSGTSSSDHLYLIFDGLDEAPKEQQELFLEFLKNISEAKSRVHIMVTSRPSVEAFKEVYPLIVEVTKEKVLGDMRMVVGNRINTFGRLRKFSPRAKAIIRRTVLKHADGMLYVEHMMRRLSYIGREGAVSKDLKNMPDTLHDLYKLMLDECRRNRSKDQYEALKRLFAWLAFSRRSLSLAEASELVKLTITENDFDIEDEIIGRSARILELSRTEPLDEDHPEDVKDDDAEDHGDDIVAEINEYRNASLTFQERSLRQYFRAVSVEAHGEEELRTPASAAHLTILKMCIDILISSADAKDDTASSELKGYAVQYWYEHLKDLDISSASDEDVRQVLISVHRIMSNESNVASLFERQAQAAELYPKRDSETTTPWYDSLQAWAVRGSTIPEDTLSQEVKAWSGELVANPKDALLPLAKAHVDNWRLESNRFFIVAAYKFAATALSLSGRYTSNVEDPLKEIISVAESFGNREQDARTLRSIGTCLMYSAFDLEDSKGRQQQAYTDGIEYLEKSVQMTGVNGKEKGYTLSTLGVLYARIEAYEKAVEALDRGLKCFFTPEAPNDVGKELQGDQIILDMHLDRGLYLWRSGKRDEALDAYNKTRKFRGDATIGGYNLDDITVIIDEMDSASGGHQLMEALKSWTEKERFDWFEFNLEYGADVTALGRMYRAAKATGETDLVLEWLNAYGKTLSPASSLLFNLKYAVAAFYNRILDDKDKTKEILRQTLAIRPKDDGGNEGDIFNERISEVRASLASIIFSQFRESSDPQRKEALFEEMKNLPGMKTEDEFQESHIGMLVVNMLRIMGPAREYQNALDRIFKTCINGLEDNVSWNDSDSLRLLVKVLASLDGLERDARITLSAQFSILDRTIYLDSEASEESSDAETADQTDDEEPSTTAPIEEHTATDNAETTDTEDAPQEKDTTKENSAAASDEDLTDFYVFCDGKCETGIHSWTEPFYLCLICTNTDLCAKCHSKRLEWNTEGGEEPWSSFCGKNHHYVKGPMAGWKGIKAGVIRIGEEEIPVKQWIKELKEERWPKAWEAFWLRQSGLKDIDE